MNAVLSVVFTTAPKPSETYAGSGLAHVFYWFRRHLGKADVCRCVAYRTSLFGLGLMIVACMKRAKRA